MKVWRDRREKRVTLQLGKLQIIVNYKPVRYHWGDYYFTPITLRYRKGLK